MTFAISRNVKITIGVIFAVILIILLGWYLFRLHNRQSETDTFKIGLNTWVGYGPLWLAQEKGYFKDEGVNVEITTIEDVAQRKTALLKGDLSAVGDTVDSQVLALNQNVPETAVMQMDVSNGADGIIATDNIKTVADLKGKKIAVQKNFVSESFLNYVLQKNGLKPSDVETIDTEAGAAGAAFVAGSVDVAVTYEPWLSKAKERNGGHLLVSSADEPNTLVDIMAINDTYLKNNPKTVQKVMRAWFKAIDYWKSNPVGANEIMGKHYNASATDYADLLTGVIWPSFEDNVSYFNPGQGKFYQVADIFGDVFLQTGQITSKPDMNKAADNSLLSTLYDKK